MTDIRATQNFRQAKVEAPAISFSYPENWEIDEAINAWVVLRPSLSETPFVPNVAVLLNRVGGESLEHLATEVLDGMKEMFAAVELMSSTEIDGIIDRSVALVVFEGTERHELFQYQRLFLLGSHTDSVVWLVQVQATGPVSHADKLGPLLLSLISNIEISSSNS
jgi:hypothetical protein